MAERHTPNPDSDELAMDSTLSETPLEADTQTPFPDLTDTGADSGAGTVAPAAGSRSTRILLGILLLAVAGFVWFNYIWQPEPQVVTGPPSGPVGSSGLAGGNGNGGTSSPLVADSSASQAGLPLLPAAERDPAAPLSPAPAPVVTDSGQLALPLPAGSARQLQVSELPFLVTAPPESVTAEDGAADDLPVSRPQAVRVSVNPFSPVYLPEPALADGPSPAPPPVVPGPETVTEVSIPDGPDQAAITTIAPPGAVLPAPDDPGAVVADQPPVTPEDVPVPAPTPPAAAAPAVSAAGPAVNGGAADGVPAQAPVSSITQALPRPLPGPPLSPVPAVLQQRRSTEDVPQPNLAQVAAVAEPAAEVPQLAAGQLDDEGTDAPAPLPPSSARVMPSDVDPLVAGITPLSRYLRDNDVSFTGMVLGPVSQGVFRSTTSPRPVVVALGQTLPGTDITLTDLRGQQAEFTLADASQFLTLELRR